MVSWDYDFNEASSSLPAVLVDRGYELDAAGNHDRVLDGGVAVSDQVVQSHNRVSSDGQYTYTYDFEGNLVSRDGGPGDYTEYVWDHRNRLAEIRQKPSAAQAATDRVRYTYNNHDLRVRKITETVNGSGHWDITEVEHYVYQGDQLVAILSGGFNDLTGSDDTTTTTGSYKRRVLSGPDADMPIYEEEFIDALIGGAGQEGPYWTVTDHGGSVREVLIDKDEYFAQHLEYDAFGEVDQVIDNAGSPVTLDQLAVDTAFAGRRWDADADLYYNRARWYDAGQGRFISEDPIGHAGGINLYAYADNDPVNQRDPSGLAAAGHPLKDASLATADQQSSSVSVRELIDQQPTLSKGALRSCIVCHNPIIMHGGSISDLPAHFQVGAMEFVRANTLAEADAAIGGMRTAGSVARSVALTGALIATAPIGVPLSAGVIGSGALLEYASTGSVSMAADTLPGVSLRHAPSQFRTIISSDATLTERGLAALG
ncbi:MAG: RHS repeat-associated core domain-containing protein, partial [Pirellulales bacterium]|nr:RHS repeat-associated core domain-containing protein [Pirellulales bacterium]